MAGTACFGQYGFGTGAGRDCNTCPDSSPCWDEHRRRVEDEQPEAVAELQRLIDSLRPRFGDRAAYMARVVLGASGRPDPYIQAVAANVHRGLLARSVPRN